MPVYQCRVADRDGHVERLVRESASEDSCLRDLSATGSFVISVRELPRGGVGAAEKRFSRATISELTDVLSLMLGSGLSLTDSLDVALGAFRHGDGNRLAALLLERLRKGASLASALESLGPAGFPSVYIGMVRIGERIGSLDQVFNRLSTYLKEEKGLRDRFASALVYPSIVLGVAFLSAMLILFVLFPRLRQAFEQLGPGMSGSMEGAMRAMNAALAVPGILLAALAACLAAVGLARRKGGAASARIDELVLSIPLVAPVLVQREILSFSFAMEALTAAGVSVEDALPEGAGTVANRALREAILAAHARLLKGERLSTAFSRSAIFPERVSRWMAICERGGHVERVFGQVRAYYQQEVEKWLTRLMSFVEPALIIAVGIMVILFVVLFIVPVFSLFGNIL